MYNESGDEYVLIQSVIIADPMRSNIIPNTYQNIVKHRVDMNIFRILEKHVVCKFLRHKNYGCSKKKDEIFSDIIEYEESRTLI